MATPALRRVKELNPSCRVTFYTHIANLVHGLPFIDDVRPMDAFPTSRTIFSSMTRNTARNAKIPGQEVRILSCVSGHYFS